MHGRIDGIEGSFVLDARRNFVPADKISMPLMFQFAREAREFEGLSAKGVRAFAEQFKNVDLILVGLPKMLDPTWSHIIKPENLRALAKAIDMCLCQEAIFEEVLCEWRKRFGNVELQYLKDVCSADDSSAGADSGTPL